MTEQMNRKQCFVIFRTWKTAFFEETRSEIYGVWEDEETAKQIMNDRILKDYGSYEYHMERCVYHETGQSD